MSAAMDGGVGDVRVPRESSGDTASLWPAEGGVDATADSPMRTGCVDTNLLLIDHAVSTYLNACNPSSPSQRGVWNTMEASVSLPAGWTSACFKYPEQVPAGDSCGLAYRGHYPFVLTNELFSTLNGALVYQCVSPGRADEYIVSMVVSESGTSRPAALFSAANIPQANCP